MLVCRVDGRLCGERGLCGICAPLFTLYKTLCAISTSAAMSDDPTVAILCVLLALTFVLLLGIPIWVKIPLLAKLLAERRSRLAAQQRLSAEAMTTSNPWDSTPVIVVNGRMITVGDLPAEIERIRREVGVQMPTTNTLSRSKVESFEICQGSDTMTGPCVICLSECMADDKLRKLSCGHAYHSKCIDEWLLQRSSCCPICKRDYSDKQASTATLPTIPSLAHV